MVVSQPVSSLKIRDGLGLKESSATIRNIVAELDEAGYLEQPHTSAGRVPTDAAYRYFVDNLISDVVLSSAELLKMRRVLSAKEDVGRCLSEALNLLSFSSADGGRFEGCGFSYLFLEPEFKDKEAVLDASYYIDHINETAERYREYLKKDAEVFIGGENPVSCAHEFGVFYVESGRRGRKQTTILVGPKRVNYERVSSYINFFLNQT